MHQLRRQAKATPAQVHQPPRKRLHQLRLRQKKKKLRQSRQRLKKTTAKSTASKPAAKKPAAKKAAASKPAAAKKPAVKSTTAKSAASKSTASKSTAAKPAAAKSTAAKSTAAKPAVKKAPAKKAAAASDGKPEALSAPRGGQKDDLKNIKGVGPKIEDILNGMGIYHFDQVASWGRKEVKWVDEELSFKGRIDREKWIAQAKKLAKGS